MPNLKPVDIIHSTQTLSWDHSHTYIQKIWPARSNFQSRTQGQILALAGFQDGVIHNLAAKKPFN